MIDWSLNILSMTAFNSFLVCWVAAVSPKSAFAILLFVGQAWAVIEDIVSANATLILDFNNLFVFMEYSPFIYIIILFEINFSRLIINILVP